MIQEHFAVSGKIKLHYLSSGDLNPLTPLVYRPGFGSDVESFQNTMERLNPRRTISLGKRGFGKSSTTESGYNFESQVSDLKIMIEDANISNFCLLASSIGVPIALGYAIENLENLKGLILLDYSARYPKMTQDWARKVVQSGYLPTQYVYGCQKESEEIELWNKLSVINCPVLIIRGGKDGVLTKEEGERYTNTLSNAKQIVFENSGHDVFKPDYERFIVTIESFLEGINQVG